jgi:hypothetical protein
VLESPSRLVEGSHSVLVGHATRVGITQKGQVRAKGSASKRNGTKRNKDEDVITKDDMAELHNQQHMNMAFENIKDVPSTELSSDMALISSGSSRRDPTMSNGSRSVGCQTVDPTNFCQLYSEGVIKCPSTSKLPGTKIKDLENGSSTHEVRLQTDKVPSHVNRTSSAASDMLTDKTSDPDIQKLSLCELKQHIDEPQEEVNMSVYYK